MTTARSAVPYRSRIRCCPRGGISNDDEDGYRIIKPFHFHHVHLLLLMTLALLPPASHAYLGPTHCVKPGTSAASVLTSSAATIQSSPSSSSSSTSNTVTKMGYSSYNHLLFDLISLYNDYQSGIEPIPDERLTFTLCPNKVIDLDDSTLPLGYIPIHVPRTTIQCGIDGNRSNNCIIRGGGKRNSQATSWNINRGEHAYKNNEFGILGGGEENVAQIYVYGESAYEITLRGLTMDNSITEDEMRLYQEYVAHFGNGGGNGGKGRRNLNATMVERNTQVDDIEENLHTALGGSGGKIHGVQPAQRLTSVAVRGKGYGHDAGPRLITIEDCKFTYHQGYAILVSPGIQGPDMPLAPEFKVPPQSTSTGSASASSSSEPLTPSASVAESQLGQSTMNEPVEGGSGTRTNQRTLNLHNNRNTLDGHRVKIINSDFVNNVSSDIIAGLISSAYSLSISNCLFERNSARAIVFVYNHEAVVDNTMFVENTVEISTVVMQTPKGQGMKESTSNGGGKTSIANSNIASAMDASHIVERSCFLGSHVGMSNVLVTDATDSGFTQRENHGRGTVYTWASKCEDGAAEKVGNDCMTNDNCVGMCVPFTSEECMADQVVTSKEYELFMNDGYSARCGSGWMIVLGATLAWFPFIFFF